MIEQWFYCIYCGVLGVNSSKPLARWGLRFLGGGFYRHRVRCPRQPQYSLIGPITVTCRYSANHCTGGKHSGDGWIVDRWGGMGSWVGAHGIIYFFTLIRADLASDGPNDHDHDHDHDHNHDLGHEPFVTMVISLTTTMTMTMTKYPHASLEFQAWGDLADRRQDSR